MCAIVRHLNILHRWVLWANFFLIKLYFFFLKRPVYDCFYSVCSLSLTVRLYTRVILKGKL